ncbi:MAG: cell division protein FtsL [Eubacteriales bacterium]|nr:cell division protein FtsL [Eubacteriales bacterium]
MPSTNRRPAYNRRYSGTSAYYTDGSAARAVNPQTQPVRRVRKVRRAKPRYVEAERTASVSMNLPLTMLLIVAVAAALFIGYRYLCLKSSLDMHMNTIKSLETRLDTLQTENDALDKSIDTSIDLNHVYNVAINELGMVHVGQDNIIRYDKTESEYVRQYEDIPDAD